MQFSTTPTLEGQSIVEYCGVVTGEAILGANIIGAWSDARRVALLSLHPYSRLPFGVLQSK
ncbi:cytoplasmic protein [Salmonella bongori]|nr:cytoplasmic protein [Salmonella bongori]